jgi:hypothetical protein
VPVRGEVRFRSLPFHHLLPGYNLRPFFYSDPVSQMHENPVSIRRFR